MSPGNAILNEGNKVFVFISYSLLRIKPIFEYIIIWLNHSNSKGFAPIYQRVSPKSNRSVFEDRKRIFALEYAGHARKRAAFDLVAGRD